MCVHECACHVLDRPDLSIAHLCGRGVRLGDGHARALAGVGRDARCFSVTGLHYLRVQADCPGAARPTPAETTHWTCRCCSRGGAGRHPSGTISAMATHEAPLTLSCQEVA